MHSLTHAPRSEGDTRHAPSVVLEVEVRWGEDNALRLEHFASHRPFVVGDSGSGDHVDFELGAATLGMDRWTVVAPAPSAGVRVFVPHGAIASFDVGGTCFDELALRAAGRALVSDQPGIAYECVLAAGEGASIHVGALCFRVGLVPSVPWKRPLPIRGALAFAALVSVFALGVSTLASGIASSGRPVRYVDAQIDLSHPTVAALVSRRAASSVRNPVVMPRTAPLSPTFLPVAPSQLPRTEPPAAQSPVEQPPATSADPAPATLPNGNVPTLAAASSAAARANVPTPAAQALATPPQEAASIAEAPADLSPEEIAANEAHRRHVAVLFAMRQGSTGLADCYARFPTSGPDAATHASHLSRCIAAVRSASRETLVTSNDPSVSAPVRNVALVEVDIEVDTHDGTPVRYAGARTFVDVDP